MKEKEHFVYENTDTLQKLSVQKVFQGRGFRLLYIRLYSHNLQRI